MDLHNELKQLFIEAMNSWFSQPKLRESGMSSYDYIVDYLIDRGVILVPLTDSFKNSDLPGIEEYDDLGPVYTDFYSDLMSDDESEFD